MCFSFEISLLTFIFSWVVSVYLLNKKINKKQKQNIIFLMIFSSMQLVDAILWFINMKKNNINFFISSYIIPSILLLQIVYNLLFINNIYNIYSYLIILISAIIFYTTYRGYTIHSNNMFKSPLWGGKENTFIGMLIFFIIIFYGRIGFYGEKLDNLIIGLVSLLFSFYFNGGYGSMWCYFANIASIYYLYEYN